MERRDRIVGEGQGWGEREGGASREMREAVESMEKSLGRRGVGKRVLSK